MIVQKNAVLLLNADYSFLNTIDIKKSLSLWARGKAKILKSGKRIVHPKLNISLPEVMILINYVHIPYRSNHIKLSKETLMLRDGFVCQYSGRRLRKSEIEIDHVIPKSRGGKDTWENLVVSSSEINNFKGNKTPEEAGIKLIRKPFRPTLKDIISYIKKDEWCEYLNE